MPIRLSGINSGLDTDAIVQELVSAYSLKTEKYEKEQTKIEWKQDAWKSLNTKIYSLYTNVSNLRFDGAYNLKKTSVSDATKASVTASSDSVTGTQKLNILQMAQASYITGGALGKDTTSTTKMSELGIKGEASFKIKTGDGKETEIKISENNTIKEVISKLKEAGVNASFDENNKRIFVSAKESGSAADFNLIADDMDGYSALSALGLNTELVDEKGNYINGGEELLAQYQEKIDEYNALVARRDARQAHNATYSALAKAGLADQGDGTGITSSRLKDMVSTLYADGSLTEEEVEAYINDASNGITLPVGKTASDVYEILATQTDNMSNVAEYVNAGNNDLISASLNDLNAQIEAAEADYQAATKVIADASVGNATKIAGQDAIIKLNGVTYTNATNTFSINGLTIETSGVTGDKESDAISLTTTVDTQGIYDKIKDFLTEYNSVINEITKLYNAEAATDYEPLTDEEKDAMSDEQIEKWENKIKGALLRRDNSLGTIMTTMINSMAQTVEVNGEKLSLSSFGISTLGFLNAAENEQYAYHIDGDEDDENTSGKTDKLMKAIQEDPDQICEFLKKLTGNLYTNIDTKMKSTELSSAYKVYNDKELDSQLKKYTQLISDWEDKVAEQEEYYYDKFSQMEVALSKLQSQTSAISGLIGS